MKKSTYSSLALLLWAIPLAACLSLITGQHMFAHAKVPLVGLTGRSVLTVHHFLSLDCGCSKKIVRHLIERRALKDISETIHLIQPEPDTVVALQSAGYTVESLDEEAAVERYHVKSVPQLAILRSGETVYQGGYSENQQRDRLFDDVQIIRDVALHHSMKEHALFGCANGHLQKTTFDRLGVKYGRN